MVIARAVEVGCVLVGIPKVSGSGGGRVSTGDVSVGDLPPVSVMSGSISMVSSACVLRFLLRVRWHVSGGVGVDVLRFAMGKVSG